MDLNEFFLYSPSSAAAMIQVSDTSTLVVEFSAIEQVILFIPDMTTQIWIRGRDSSSEVLLRDTKSCPSVLNCYQIIG